VPHSFAAHAHSSAPREAVWTLVADPRTWSDWGAWSSAEILREGAPPPGGLHTIKRLKLFPTSVVEEVTVFEPPSRLGYELRSGLPLRAYRASIELTDTPGAVGTEIRWGATFEPKAPGTGAVHRRLLERFTRQTAERLARAAERER
jgi:hypothetical protein